MKIEYERRIDDLGRIVISKDIRKMFGIEAGDFLKISVEGTKICVEKRRNEDER